MSKAAALLAAIRACEAEFSDILPLAPGVAEPRIEEVAGHAPVEQHSPSASQRCLHDAPPDIVLVSSGAGPAPDHWAKGQTSELLIRIYDDAVHLSETAYDTVFVRGTTVELRSLNGLLRRLFASRLLSGAASAGRMAMARPGPALPRRRLLESDARYARRLRARLDARKGQNSGPPASIRDRVTHGNALQTEIAERAFGFMRSCPEVQAAQTLIWGEPDEAPEPWFEPGALPV